MLIRHRRGLWDRGSVPSVAGVLGDLEALGLLPQRSTVSGAVLADNADLCSIDVSSRRHDENGRLGILVVRLAMVFFFEDGYSLAVIMLIIALGEKGLRLTTGGVGASVVLR